VNGLAAGDEIGPVKHVQFRIERWRERGQGIEGEANAGVAVLKAPGKEVCRGSSRGDAQASAPAAPDAARLASRRRRDLAVIWVVRRRAPKALVRSYPDATPAQARIA
jgi:hypothetical protein